MKRKLCFFLLFALIEISTNWLMAQSSAPIPYRKNNKWGFVNSNKQLIVPIQYDSVSNFYAGIAVIKAANLYGTIDVNGKAVLPLKYSYIELLPNGNVWVEKDPPKSEESEILWALFDKKGKPLTNFQYEYFPDTVWTGYMKVADKGLMGVMDEKGRMLVECKYGDMELLENDIFRAINVEQGVSFLFNTSGEAICSYEKSAAILDPNTLKNGWFLFNENGKYSITDAKTGRKSLTNATKKTDIRNLQYQRIGVNKNGKWEILRPNGMKLNLTQYDSLGIFKDGFAIGKVGEHYQIIDTLGFLLGGMEFDNVGKFQEEFIRIQKKGKWGFLSKKGALTVVPRYEEVYDFELGYAAVKNNKMWGIINKMGNEVLPCQYQYLHYFYRDGTDDKPEYINYLNRGFVEIRFDGKWGTVSTNNEIIIPPKYEIFIPTYRGYAIVKNPENGKWGVIDSTEEVVIPFEYDEIHESLVGFDVSRIDSTRKDDAGDPVYLHSLVSRKGGLLTNKKYDYISSFMEGLAIVVEDEYTYGFINTAGEEITPIKYYRKCSECPIKKVYAPEMSECSLKNGNFLVWRGNKWGMINRQGKEFLPCQFAWTMEDEDPNFLFKPFPNFFHAYLKTPEGLLWLGEISKDGNVYFE